MVRRNLEAASVNPVDLACSVGFGLTEGIISLKTLVDRKIASCEKEIKTQAF